MKRVAVASCLMLAWMGCASGAGADLEAALTDTPDSSSAEAPAQEVQIDALQPDAPTDCSAYSGTSLYATAKRLGGDGYGVALRESGRATIETIPASLPRAHVHDLRLAFDQGATYDIQLISPDLGALPFGEDEEVRAFLFVEEVFWINVLLAVWSPAGDLLLFVHESGMSYDWQDAASDCQAQGVCPVAALGDVVCQTTDVCGTGYVHDLAFHWADGGEPSVATPGAVDTVVRPSGRFLVLTASADTYDWSESECTDNPSFWISAAIKALP